MGNEGVGRVGFWEETSVLFLGRWYREWEEKSLRSMEFKLCSLHVATSNSPNLCIYVLYYVLYYISSLCSGGFTDTTGGMCWFGVCRGYGTDVPRTGCTRMGSVTRRVSFYASLVGGGLRLSGLDGKTGLLTGLLAGKQGWKCPVVLLATCCGSKSLKVILIDSDFRGYPVLSPLVTL